MKIKDYIKDIFLRLTSRTVPYCQEVRFVDDIMQLMFPEGIEIDKWGNYFYKIGDSRTIFASHLDTVSRKYEYVKHVIEGDIVRTDGMTTLGADDKAGVTVMLYMIENKIPGLYYFFIGEEVGCIGSGYAANSGNFEKKYDRIISFDRRNTGSVITHQSSGRCCSDEFADALCLEFNTLGMSYEKDRTGVYTDSAEFMSIIPECTNISVGYYKEHTKEEHQDIEHLTNLAIACINVDWENLPVSRDPSKYDDDRWGSYSSKTNINTNNSSARIYDDWNDWYDDEPIKHKRVRRSRKNTKIGRVFHESGADLIEISEGHRVGGDRYNWIMEKFVNDKFTWDELQVIKEYYLDMKTDNHFYDYLCRQVVDC
jgi:hypothetical protein